MLRKQKFRFLLIFALAILGLHFGGPAKADTITMSNGYPMLNGNFIDCNGNIDNDAAHHTTAAGDTDPAHHVGQNCPAGSFVATNGGSNNGTTGGNTGGGGTNTNTITMSNGYPMLNGNFIDCNGNIDNDPAHHVADSSDTDPGHHVGQNCPAGSFVATNGGSNNGTTGGNTGGGNNTQIQGHLVQGSFSGAAFEVIVSDPDINQITNSQLQMTLTSGSTVLTKTVPPSNIITDSTITSQGQTFTGPGATFFWSVSPGTPQPADSTYAANATLLNNSNSTIQDLGSLGNITFGQQQNPPPSQPPVTAGLFTATLLPGSDRSFLNIQLSSTESDGFLIGKAALKVQVLDNDGNVATENILTGGAVSGSTRAFTRNYIWPVAPQPCDNNLALTGAAAPIKAWVIDQATEANFQAMGIIGTQQTGQGPIGNLACVAMDSSGVNPTAINSGQTATMTASFTNHAQSNETAKIVLSIRDNTGKIITDQTFDNQAFVPNETKTFQFTAPNNLTTGDYHFAARVFLFGDLIHSYDPAGTLTVNGGTTTQDPFQVTSFGITPGPQVFQQGQEVLTYSLNPTGAASPNSIALKVTAIDANGNATVVSSLDNTFASGRDAFINSNQLNPGSYHFKLDVYNPGFNGLLQTFSNIGSVTVVPLNAPLAAQLSDFDISGVVVDRTAFSVYLVAQQAQTLQNISKVDVDLVRNDGSVAEHDSFAGAPQFLSSPTQLQALVQRFDGQGSPPLPTGTFKVNVLVTNQDGTTQNFDNIGSITF